MDRRGAGFVAFFAVLAAFITAVPVQAQGTTLTPHGPIFIFSNDDFDAAHGVVNGSGTAWDPYIIEGWEVQFYGSPEDAYDPRAGIFVRGTDAFFVVRNCRVTQTADRDGILLQELKNGAIEDTEVTGSRAGVRLEKTESVRLTRLNVHDNAGVGVALVEGSDHRILESRIEGNTETEITVDATQGDELARNQVHATRGAAGLDVRDATGFVARDNAISGVAGRAGAMGVWFEGVTRGTFTTNEVRDFADDGFVLVRSSGGELRGNVLSGNGHQTGGAGLHVKEAGEAHVRANQVLSSAGSAIELEGASRMNVEDNIVTLAHGAGIELASSSYNLVRGNTITEVTGPAILLKESSHNEVQNNEARSNAPGDAGAISIGGNDNYVAENRAHDNDGAGIAIEIWMARNEVVRNDVKDNTGPGILSRAAKERNTIRDNVGTVVYDEEAEKKAAPTGITPLPLAVPLVAVAAAALIARGSLSRAGPRRPS